MQQYWQTSLCETYFKNMKIKWSKPSKLRKIKFKKSFRMENLIDNQSIIKKNYMNRECELIREIGRKYDI